MKKKIIASIVVLTLLFGMLPIYSQATDELRNCEYCLNLFKDAMKMDGIINEENFLSKIKEYAENLMAEAGQLAAMAQKTLDSMEEWKWGNKHETKN